MSEIYVVTGAPRSGTSLTAGILHKLGVPMFPSSDRAIYGNVGDEWNRGGYFADEDFHALIAPRLPGLSLPDPNWSPDGDSLGIIAAMVAERSVCPKWGVKGQHAWIGAAVLQQMGYDVRVVRTSRPLAQSQASYLARIGPASKWQAGGAEFIAACKAQADAFYDSFNGPKLTVDFLSMLADPVAGVTAIATFAGAQTTQEAIDFVNLEFVRFS